MSFNIFLIQHIFLLRFSLLF